MNMYTSIIYLSICILITVFIPAVRKQWKEFIIIISKYYKAVKMDNHTNLQLLKRKVIYSILLLIIVPLFFILTPLLFPLLIKYNKYNKIVDEKRTREEKIKDNNLYFWKTNGVGDINCLDCDYEENIISFIHGLNNSSTGLQCQSCGNFHVLDGGKNKTYCECGGILEREKPIFCPVCKSKNIVFNTYYMT